MAENSQLKSDLSRRPGDAFDRITYHVTNLWRVWNGSPVRDLAESEAGYESALRELVAAVEELDKLREGQ